MTVVLQSKASRRKVWIIFILSLFDNTVTKTTVISSCNQSYEAVSIQKGRVIFYE